MTAGGGDPIVVKSCHAYRGNRRNDKDVEIPSRGELQVVIFRES